MLKFVSRHHILIILSAIVLVLAASCSPARKVQKRGGYLLTSHTVKTDRPGISTSDLVNFAQPKPNRKFLGLRHRVWIYDAFSGKRDTKFRRWVRTHLGSRPVLLDSVLVDNSLNPMKVYLNNKGYFGAQVERKINIHGSRASVVYNTITPEPYNFSTISYVINDDSISYFVNQLKEKSLLKSGMQYDSYLMRDERERITRDLKDLGYYAFSREYIFYEVDTSANDRLAKINIIIKNVKNVGSGSNDTLLETPHIRYYINNVYVYTSERGLAGDTTIVNDTIAYYSKPDSTYGVNPDFYHIFKLKPRLRPEGLARNIFVKPGDPFSQKNVNLTYNRLQNLALSRYVSVNIIPPRNVFSGELRRPALLDCDIRMVRSPVNMFTIEAEATNAGGFIGMGSSFNYQNRNIFRGSETLRLKLFGALEIQPPLGVGNEANKRLFNSMEGGFQAGLDFPTIISPFRFRPPEQNSRAKTTVAMGFNYQSRTQYLRYVSSVSLGYEWNAHQTMRHLFSPIDLSSISITRDSAFTNFLNSLKDRRFFNQYTDHLIMAMKYTFIFNNQDLQLRKNFFYFKLGLESAGNFLNLYSNLSKARLNENRSYTILGIRYAQYLRGDVDFRYYRPITEKQKVVYRAAFGLGVPYGNSTSLPFEKGFFAGGANGLRGWPVRSLGPGAYRPNDSISFENIGDLSIEFNLEYRFPVYSFVNGALFTDVGNIWLLKQNEDFPGGEFRFDRLVKTMAFDGGLGFRFDFSFFIFRIDGGLAFYDPGKETDSRWISFSKFQLKNINWNFGIGYPF